MMQNDYFWCISNFVEFGWDQKVKNFIGYGFFIFLFEYGCNYNVCDFGEFEFFMYFNMISVYFGGFMYEYFEEFNEYGIVKIEGGDKGNGFDQIGKCIEMQFEFNNLVKVMKVFFVFKGFVGVSIENKVFKCFENNDYWIVSIVFFEIFEEVFQYFENGVGKGFGFNGKGFQWVGYVVFKSFEFFDGDVQGSIGGFGFDDNENVVFCGVVLIFFVFGFVVFVVGVIFL